MSEQESPPNIVLDRESFTKHTKYVALKVPVLKCNTVRKELGDFILKIPKVSPVIKPQGGDETTRIVLLKSVIKDDGQTPDPPFSDKVMELVTKEGLEVTDHVVTRDYSMLSADEVLRKVLPEGCEVPSSFETVGHVAHLNIRDNLLPYKHLIAEVLLEKNPRLRTVVNKVGMIETKFRTFDLEVLGGDQCLDVEVKEGGATFVFNYAEVYWNSRLQGEHARIVKAIPKTSLVWDMFAGVGPFAIPLSLKGCKVYANDLNPRSYHYLQANAQRNKVGSNLEAFNLDGREFVESRIAQKLPVHHIIMNLPNSALEFLEIFPGRFGYQKEPPLIHVYCFSKAADPVADAIQRASDVLGQALPSAAKAHVVRDVAPRKAMVCITFPAPAEASPAGGGGNSSSKRKAEEEKEEEGGDSAATEKGPGGEEGGDKEVVPSAKKSKADGQEG